MVNSVHVYPSPFEYETRILKVTRTLVEQTPVSRVIVIASAKSGLPERAAIDAAREVWRIDCRLKGDRFWARALRFAEWSARVVWNLRRERVDIVNCHSLSVLPLCVTLKFLHRAILIYEPHELETETPTFIGFRRRLAKWAEGALIGRAAAVIAVSDSIARNYRDSYRLKEVAVIMNVPEQSPGPDLGPNPVYRRLFGIPDDNFIFMFQGALDPNRGAGLVLAAFKSVPSDRHVVFLGFGPMESEIRTAAAQYPNIHFHAAVPPSQVIDYTHGADIGFALLEADCLNHQYALPNKFFHYLHAGLPVIVSDLQEMGAMVDRWQCGWRVANTVEAIVARVTSITRVEAVAAAQGARRSRSSLVWDNEAKKLVALYRAILPPPQPAADRTQEIRVP
jgi:glycosyltransferase involved in cell wall biosynthesis